MAATIAPAADPRILAGHDIHAQRGEYLFALPKCLISTLEDARDEPLLHLLGNVLLTTLPAAAALFLCGCRQHWIGAIYMILNYVLYMQRFMLTLHFSEHRRLFKKEYAALNFLAPNVLCVLFGIPTGVYRLHHCIIHHVEENSSAHDVSSTEPFQRDNLLHFLLYWMRYTVGAWFELPIYALRRERYGWAAASMSAETAYWAAITLLWRVNPVATMWTLVLPFCLSSFLTMFGNWSQHVFVNPDTLQQHGAYKAAYNLLDCADNRRTYNDGYHVVHHANSRLHWSQLPHTFLDTLDQYDAHDALVFQGIGFFDVGLAVFTGRLGFLADHVVPCGRRQAARTRAEWVDVFRERLRPVAASPPGGRVAKGQ